MGHPAAFELANKVKKIAPAGLDHVFFVNSGSEAVETALKMALQYHRLRGEGTRTRLIGRERGYHGVNLAGTTVGGMPPNRKAWSPVMVPGVDHLPHTHDLSKNAFSRGLPEHGAHLALELERLIGLHDASNIAAVMCAMQKTSTDMCMYYDAQAHSAYCGLFSGDFHTVFPAYYAFRAFGELYIQKNEAFSASDADGVYVCAASGEKNLALIVNHRAEAVEIALDAPAISRCLATDETHNFESIEIKANGGVLELAPYAVWLLEF
jgi:hypothetical protein